MENFEGLLLFTQSFYQLLQNYLTTQQENTNHSGIPSISEIHEQVGLSSIARPPALLQISNRFKFSEFESYILLLCAAIELEPNIAQLCSQVQNRELSCPTPYLTLQLLPQPSWSAFNANSPLRHWQFIHFQDSQIFTLSPLSIDRSIFLYLLGENYIDPYLDGLVKPLLPENTIPLTSPQQDVATSISSFWTPQSSHYPSQTLQLHGTDLPIHREIVLAAAQKSGSSPHRATLSSFTLNTSLASNPTGLRNIARRWERAARLTNGVLLLECQGVDLTEPTPQFILKTLLEEIKTPLILSAEDRLNLPEFSLLIFEIPSASFKERKAIWLTYLGDRARSLNSNLDLIADNFSLSPQSIATVCRQIPQSHSRDDLTEHLGCIPILQDSV
ncbi:hypothetical protein [Baaleninema simplex]|uniref:hypothetical protein n=1 Tax=Baaleninema simplex TaxID=2862350 RepID=UPI0003472E17|nr:hypothetical protein [Baaleninema simplex]